MLKSLAELVEFAIRHSERSPPAPPAGNRALHLTEDRLLSNDNQTSTCALRTFQRRVQTWRRRHGPPREVFFAQVIEPGQSVQVDWTHADELGVTLAGQPFAHLLCHAVLPFSPHFSPNRGLKRTG